MCLIVVYLNFRITVNTLTNETLNKYNYNIYTTGISPSFSSATSNPLKFNDTFKRFVTYFFYFRACLVLKK